MATTVAHLQAVLSANTRDFDRAMGRSESKMSKFGAVAKAAALGAGVAVAYGLGKVAKIGWDEFNQGQKVAAQTNAVLKSTGRVANVSAKDVERLGKQLMLKSGVDDEVIKSGQNMLLTFTNIRNEVGKGNDIFRQATQATLDLSVATGKDMVDASVMVGKALNDPVRGIGALRRVGVQLTEQQEKQIKALVKSGDTMKAQKIILGELRKEFGGSAEAAGKTFGGQINILRERFNNWAGDMTAKAIPLLQRFGQWLMPLVEKAVRIVGEVIDKNVRPGIEKMVDVIRRNEPQLRGIWEDLTQIIRTMWKVAGPILKFLFTQVLPRVLNVAIKWVSLYVQAFAKIIDTARRVVNWFRNSFLPGVQRVWDAVREKVTVVADFIRDRIRARLEAVRNVFALVRATAKFTWEFIRDKAQLVIDKVAAIIKKLKDFVAYVKSIPGKIADAFGKIGSFFGSIASKVGGWGNNLTVGPMTGGLGSVTALANRAGLQMTSGFRPGDPGWHGQNRARDYAGTASAMLAFARMVAAAFGPRLLELIHTPLGFGIKNGQRVSNSFWGSRVLSDHYDHVHVAMDRGGIVPGRRGAPVPILAHGGETVLPTHRSNGLPMVVNVQLGHRTLASALIDLNDQFRRANGGRGIFG